MKIGLFKKACSPLSFFILCGITVTAVFSGEVKKDDKSPGEEAKPPESRWTFDGGGQIRVRGDFARNQNLTDFSFTPGKRESQFLERTRLHGSVENPALHLKAFAQPQWYGRWGGIDKRSAFDLYQGYLEWEKILDTSIGIKAGRQEFYYGSAFFLGSNDFYNGLNWEG